MEVKVKKSFVKELLKCPSYFQKSVKATLDVLEKSETLAESNIDYVVIKCQNKNETYIRIRLGGYRIGAEIVEPNIILITIGSRGDIYKTFPS